jgi:hypothetical protein
MAVHVGEATTEVVAQPDPAHTSQESGLTWEDGERWRALRDRLERDSARTAAEGFDD